MKRRPRIEYLVATGIAVLISILIIGLISRSESSKGKKAGGRELSSEEKSENLRHCPICSSELPKGEKVKSVLYPGTTDRMMEIYGCPHCYPSNSKHPRICPVCSRRLRDTDLIYARYFPRKEKPHVHVLGCNGCYTRRR